MVVLVVVRILTDRKDSIMIRAGLDAVTMYYQKRSPRSPQKKDRSGRGNRSYQNPMSFKTQCSDCGDNCTVPFKPSGHKPVRCSNCFKGGERSRGSERFGSNDRKSFKRSFDKPRFQNRSDDSGIQEKLEQLNQKMDRIINMLRADDTSFNDEFRFDH